MILPLSIPSNVAQTNFGIAQKAVNPPHSAALRRTPPHSATIRRNLLQPLRNTMSHTLPKHPHSVNTTAQLVDSSQHADFDHTSK